MKRKGFVLIICCLAIFNSNAQFIEFHSSQEKFTPPAKVTFPDGTVQTNDIPAIPTAETKTTTGYILDNSGNITKKVQLKIKAITENSKTTVYIVSYYNVDPTFGGGKWSDFPYKMTAYDFAGKVPITNLEKVAYANFTYYAFWDGSGKIWFNM